MQLFFLVLVFCFVLFLFRLYHLASDDYVLIKKNISLEDIFNAAFICSLIALFFARLFYVIFHFSPNFLNPLVFLIFPYFPGLSLVGGILGGGISLLIYSRRKKFPIKRIFDFFTVALLFSLSPGLIGYIFLSESFTQGQIVRLGLLFITFVITSVYIYPKANSLEIKDGSLSMLFIIFYTLVSLLANSIDNPGIKNFIDNKENLIHLGLLLVGVVLIIKQEILGRIDLEK